MMLGGMTDTQRRRHLQAVARRAVIERELERSGELCSACESRPAGHGHFALYCEPCSELPYGQAAAL